MNKREHFFWSLTFYSLSIFLYSVILDFRDLSTRWYIILFIIVLFSILFNDWANFLISRMKSINKKRGENVNKIKLTDDDKRRILKLRISAYTLLFFTVVFTGVASMPMTDSSISLIVGYMTAISGGSFPDLDTIPHDTKYHRNPFTHSGMFVVPIGLISTLILPVIFLKVLTIPILAYMIGVTSHLVCDNFNSNGTLSDAFVGLLTIKGAPGDIRGIRTNRERQWLLYHYAFLIFFILLGFMRMDLRGFMDYDPIWNGSTIILSPIPIIIFIITGMYLLVGYLLYRAWGK